MKTPASLFLSAFLIFAVTSFAQKTSKEPSSEISKNEEVMSQATFAAGCFWHEEALFRTIKGVSNVVSGYAGGTAKNPDYATVENGKTGYAESVTVYYDSNLIPYETLLKVYFAAQDPTSVNGQSPDFGSQYRSIAFYTNENQKKQIIDYINRLSASHQYNAPIAVQVMPLQKFWPAERYHQDYVAKNPGSSYVQHVSIPEIKAFQKRYPELIKPGHFF